MTDQSQHIENDQLQAYLDGILDSSTLAGLQAHLEGCPSCREELIRLERLETRLENLPEIQYSGDLSQAVLARLQEERSLSPTLTWQLLVQAVAAGALIGALIPVLQAAGWLPSLLETRLKLQAGLNIFLAQLISGWVVWWEGAKLQFTQVLASFDPLAKLPWNGYSPWLVIGVAGLLIIVFNAVLLGRQPQIRGNHHKV